MVKQFTAMFKARSMEFVRDKGTLFWNIFFPIILVIGFAFAFSGSGDKVFKVGVIADVLPSEAFYKTQQIEFVNYSLKKQSLDSVLKRLKQHQIDFVIDTEHKNYWINEQSGKSELVKKLFLGELNTSQSNTSQLFQEQKVQGKAIRYVDWVVPGVIGMNVLMSCLFGVGYVIVRYRKNGVLKRLKATPVSAGNFLLAQGASRFVIVLLTCVLVFIGTDIFLNFTMNGSWLLLLLTFCLGIASMIALGLAFASRFKSEELANGLMNLVTFPMILLSGVFYSLEGAPDFLKVIAAFLPLTHFIDASRAIMLEGAKFLQILPDLGYLTIFTAFFIGLAVWLFRWD